MTPEAAAMFERLWLDVMRMMLLATGAAWAGVLFVLIVREAVRARQVQAGLRDLGVTTLRPGEHDRGAARARPAPHRRWSTGASTPVRGRRWARGE